MMGFKVQYTDSDGLMNETFLGNPMSSFSIKGHVKDTVVLMFHLAHPGCEVVSCNPCSLADYEKGLD